MLAAYQATTGAHTARVQVRIRIDAQGGSGAAVHASELADGVIDFTHGTARLSTQLPTGGRSESRLVAGVLYTQTPAALTAQPGHKPWLQVPLPPGTALSTGSDPTQLLSLLRGAATLIRTVGTEKVRGTDTTHYTTQINLTKLAQEASPSPPPGRPDPTAVLRRLFGRDTLPLELWVDNQQRIWRLQTTLPTHRQNGAGPTQPVGATATPQASGSATTTEEFYAFGVAVNVLAPPADQVQIAPTITGAPGPVPPTAAR